MRLLADEDFPLPAVIHLRDLGHDVLSSRDAGMANDETPDAAVLELATHLDRALITHNRRHFRQLHALNPNHAGLILCTRDSDFLRLARRLHEAMLALPALRGQLVRVVRPHSAES